MTTIQRQYNLPNCKLILEGLPDETAAVTPSGRPSISTLVNVECHFVGHEKPLIGGHNFLAGLTAAVSHYVQEYLSGVPHGPIHNSKPDLVHLQRMGENLHRLTIYPQFDSNHHVGEPVEPRQIDLKTLQLFDLVEAIDQLLADTQTLPELSLKLAPVSKRYLSTQEPILKRTAPAALGLSSLAVAAIALFFLPVPEVRPPEPEPTTQESHVGSPAPTTSPNAEPAGPPPDEPVPSPTESPSSVDESLSPDASSNPNASTDTNEASIAAEQDLEALVGSTPDITDPEILDELTSQLRNTLDEAWEREHTFEQELVYRVGVAENGDILGFKQTDQASIDYTDEIPLLDLLYQPIGDTPPRQEAIAQFRVVFRPDGIIEVSPWHGRPND